MSSYLDEAISLIRHIINLCQSPFYSTDIVKLLGQASIQQFEHTHHCSVIDECILLQRKVLNSLPDSPLHPQQPHFLVVLAHSLKYRAYKFQREDDIVESIKLFDKALNIQGPSSLEMEDCLSIMSSLSDLYWQQDNEDKCIEILQKIVGLENPNYIIQLKYLKKFAALLCVRYTTSLIENDLKEIVILHNKIHNIQDTFCPSEKENMFDIFIDCVVSFGHSLSKSNIDYIWTEQISKMEHMINCLPTGDPIKRAECLLIFAITLNLCNPKPHGMADIMSSFASEVLEPPKESGINIRRFHTLRYWASAAYKCHHNSALAAYDLVLQALPQLLSLKDLHVKSRQQTLSHEVDSLACKAALCAIEFDQLEKAIEYLEAGRAVFWFQTLSFCSSFDDLQEVLPDLSDRLTTISTIIHHGYHHINLTKAGRLNNKEKEVLDKEALHLKQLEEEWFEGLQKIQNLQGFEHFMHPDMESIHATATLNPVVYLIANNNSSSCLIITSTYIHHIPLPNFPNQKLFLLAKKIHLASMQSTISFQLLHEWVNAYKMESQFLKSSESERLGVKRGRTEENVAIMSSDKAFAQVLTTLWQDIVKPVIDFLGICVSTIILHYL